MKQVKKEEKTVMEQVTKIMTVEEWHCDKCNIALQLTNPIVHITIDDYRCHICGQGEYCHKCMTMLELPSDADDWMGVYFNICPSCTDKYEDEIMKIQGIQERVESLTERLEDERAAFLKKMGWEYDQYNGCTKLRRIEDEKQ